MSLLSLPGAAESDASVRFVSKIIRVRKEEQPGTGGGSRRLDQEGEAVNRGPSVGIR